MCFYFCSATKTDDSIPGLTGTKAILLQEEGIENFLEEFKDHPNPPPEVIALKFFRDEANENIPEDQLKKYLLDLYHTKNSKFEGYFLEEFSHFQCISRSIAASFLHIKNVLLRVGLASYNYRHLTQLKKGQLTKSRINKYIVIYYLDIASFYYLAIPFVEAHHLLALETYNKNLKIGNNHKNIAINNDKEIHHDLYEERILKCKTFLDENFKDKFINENDSYKLIADIIDNKYAQLKFPEMPSSNNEYQYTKKDDLIYLGRYVILFKIFFRDVLPLSLSYHILKEISGSSLFHVGNPIIPHFKSHQFLRQTKVNS